MIITNSLNLPQAFVNAIQNSRHNADKCLSATTLLKGTKEIVLTHRHFDEITIDASEEVWAVFGSATHLVLEHQEDEAFKEEPFEVEVNGWKVTGKVDRYDMKNETIEDWKTASVWKVLYQDFTDWRRQGLIYAWLLKKSGLNVRHIRFVALLKDHSKTDAKRRADYPQAPAYVYEFDVKDEDLENIETFIETKVTDVILESNKEDDDIKICDGSERWSSDPKFAVMKEGRKTALKVCDSEEGAEGFIKEQPEKDREKLSIEKRPGIDKKCLDYCPCAAFCNHYKTITEITE